MYGKILEMAEAFEKDSRTYRIHIVHKDSLAF